MEQREINIDKRCEGAGWEGPKRDLESLGYVARLGGLMPPFLGVPKIKARSWSCAARYICCF